MEEAIEQHKKWLTFENKKRKCKICGDILPNIGELAKHRKEKHPDEHSTAIKQREKTRGRTPAQDNQSSSVPICPICKGTGQVDYITRLYSPDIHNKKECHGCDGKGWLNLRTCPCF